MALGRRIRFQSTSTVWFRYELINVVLRTDIDGDRSEWLQIGSIECAKIKSIHLGATVTAEKLIVKIKAHLGNDEMPSHQQGAIV